MKSHTFTVLFALSLAVLACSLPLSTPAPAISPQNSPDQPTTTIPTVENIPQNEPTQDILTIGSDLSNGFSIESVPAVTDDGQSAPWDVAPAYQVITLPNYPIQGHFHQPKIYIYPAQEYASINEGVAHNIQILQDIISNPTTQPTREMLPGVPFFNAGGIFASNIQPVTFKNGRGVRWVTEYAQYFAPINNRELFYMFQGLSNDGQTYIIAILPINHPSLPADEKIDASLPAGGIPFPADPAADMTGYYDQVTNMLNASQPQAFTPTLIALDELIASISIP